MNHDLGEIMFEREFEAIDAAGNISHIKLSVGTPQLDTELIKDPEHQIWFCSHQIVGIGSGKVDFARGIDTLDALLTSLKMADAILKFYSNVHHKNITWQGQNDFGLPSSGYENISNNSAQNT